MTKVIDKIKKFAGLTDDGLELPDPTPVAIPVHLRVPESMDSRIARIVSHSLSKAAQEQGFETFEEADDFDIDDDPIDPETPWEKDHDLATAHAAERGVVSPPTPAQTQRAENVKKKYSKKEEKTPLEKKIEETPPEGK
jgi:hypothetical protein